MNNVNTKSSILSFLSESTTVAKFDRKISGYVWKQKQKSCHSSFLKTEK